MSPKRIDFEKACDESLERNWELFLRLALGDEGLSKEKIDERVEKEREARKNV